MRFHRSFKAHNTHTHHHHVRRTTTTRFSKLTCDLRAIHCRSKLGRSPGDLTGIYRHFAIVGCAVDHVVELPTANRSICGRSPGLSFTHLSASMAVVGVRPELVQATEACSAVRTCARWPEGRLSSASSIVLELDSTKITCSPAGELESTSAADGHQTTHWLGPTATRSRSGIAAWHWPRRSTTCQARRSSGEPGPAAPMADTAIWSTFSWPRANVLSARALPFVSV